MEVSPFRRNPTRETKKLAEKKIHSYLNHRRPKLTSQEKAKEEFMNASRVVWLGVKLREEPLKIWTRYKE